MMAPYLSLLQAYPFEKLHQLFAGVHPDPGVTPINLSIGEPKHSTPQRIKDALIANLDMLENYPTTKGSDALRASISNWIAKRYGITPPDPKTEILPVNGTREALFAFAQTVIDTSTYHHRPIVVLPNPFYQIYEGATLLAGAEPRYVNCTAQTGFQPDWDSVPPEIWARTQLVYTCSPGNPTGKVALLEEWKKLFDLSDRYGFVIASDECYSEIYFGAPPLGSLEAATKLGRDFTRLIMFSSLSKRSNVPGMRSGFVAGDAQILKSFMLYRTYHGSAMSPPIQTASAAAWEDEAHVEENRRQYKAKFEIAIPRLQSLFDLSWPDAAFYLWIKTPISDQDFALQLYREEGVIVLPGSYLGRKAQGINPGENYIRIALVCTAQQSEEAIERLLRFTRHRLEKQK